MITLEGDLSRSINSVMYGLSSDTKPIEIYQGLDIPNGAKFFEMDTQNVMFYDKQNKMWL